MTIDEPKIRKRRVAGGVATSDLVFSAFVADNSEVFPQVLALHVPKGAVIADVTYGKGVFWKRVPAADYTLLASDLDPKPQEGLYNVEIKPCDCHKLPYQDEQLDCVVLDPPYM